MGPWSQETMVVEADQGWWLPTTQTCKPCDWMSCGSYGWTGVQLPPGPPPFG